MSIQSNAMSELPRESQVVPPAVISEAQRMYWSVRRELWENRSIYLAPLGVAVVFLFGFLISLMTLPNRTRIALALAATAQHEALEQPYVVAEGLIMASTFIVGLFYCLEAMHSERRDRSILFWKSLPVSDLTTVLSKLAIPMVVLPLLTTATTFVTHLIMLLLSSVVLLGSGVNIETLWTHVSLFQRSLMDLYHLVTVHSLWYAPIFGWLLLASAWARRAAFLWAFLPPFAIGIVEKIAFNTSHFATLILYRLSGPQRFDFNMPSGMQMGAVTSLDLARFLSTPGLWTGLAVAAIFIAATVQVRRYRGPV